jgi:hypothetical protein
MTASRVSLLLVAWSALVSCEVRVGSQPPVGGNGASFPIGSAGGRMLSSDGVLLAAIAPSSRAPAAVTVAPADLAKLKASFAEHEIVAAYELGPSGSTFSPAVAVELDLSRIAGLARDGEMLLLWRSEGAGFVLVSGQSVIDEGPGGAFVVRGEVPHFSTVVLTRRPEMQLRFTNDDFADVGQPVASSGRLVATAASQAHALVVVMESTAGGALTAGQQARDFGALLGGAKDENRPYDPVTCATGGIGEFALAGTFTAFTTMKDGKRTDPENVTRRETAKVLCHVPTGTVSIGGPGTVIGGSVQTLTVSQPTVRAGVGEKFVLEIELRGRNAGQGVSLTPTIPAIVSDPVLANPPSVGAVTKVAMLRRTVLVELAGAGGARVECLKAGETGLEIATTIPPTLVVTTKVVCVPPPPPEDR